MSHTQTILLHYIVIAKPLAYGVIFLGAMFEGDIFLFTSAFLTSAGFLEIWYMIPLIFLGSLVGDSLWFFMGPRIIRASGFLGRTIIRLTAPFAEHLRTRPFHTIFISKFAYGLHRFIVARAQESGLKTQNFLRLDAPAILIWMSIVGTLGYFSGASIALVQHYIKFTEVALAIGLVFFMAFEYGVRVVMKKRI